MFFESQLSFVTLIASTLILLLLHYLWRVCLKPFLLLQECRGKGGLIKFIPFGGIWNELQKDVEKKGDFFASWRELAEANPSNKFIATNVGENRMIFLTDPELVKQLTLQHQNYKKAGNLGIWFYLFGDGIEFSSGPVWKKHRNILNEGFKFDFLLDQIPCAIKTAHKVFDSIDISHDIDLMEEMQQITSEVSAVLFCGDSITEQKVNGRSICSELVGILTDCMQFEFSRWNNLLGWKYAKLGILPEHRRLKKRIDDYKQFLIQYVENRRSSLEEKLKDPNFKHQDLLEMLLLRQKTTPNDCLNDKDIIEEFMTILIAGMDTTAHVLTLSLYYMHKYPDYAAVVREEIAKFGSKDEDLVWNNISQMDYTLCLFKEAMRMIPVSPYNFSREPLFSHSIGGIKVRKGDFISAGHLFNYSNGKYFKNPKQFNPYRFKRDHRDFDEAIMNNSFCYQPFSAGQRNCIGQHQAMLVAKITLSIFLNKFDYLVLPNDMKLQVKFLYEPLEPLKFRLTQKQ